MKYHLYYFSATGNTGRGMDGLGFGQSSSLFGVVNVLITTTLSIAARFLVIGPFDRFVLC